MADRLGREACVLFSTGTGDVMCGKYDVESMELVLSSGAGGEKH